MISARVRSGSRTCGAAAPVAIAAFRSHLCLDSNRRAGLSRIDRSTLPNRFGGRIRDARLPHHYGSPLPVPDVRLPRRSALRDDHGAAYVDPLSIAAMADQEPVVGDGLHGGVQSNL